VPHGAGQHRVGPVHRRLTRRRSDQRDGGGRARVADEAPAPASPRVGRPTRHGADQDAGDQRNGHEQAGEQQRRPLALGPAAPGELDSGPGPAARQAQWGVLACCQSRRRTVAGPQADGRAHHPALEACSPPWSAYAAQTQTTELPTQPRATRTAAEHRGKQSTYLLLRNSPPDRTGSPAPNSPTRLHSAHQPGQETALPSRFARRGRFVETLAFQAVGRLPTVRRVDRVPPVEPAAQGEGGQRHNGIPPGNGHTSGPCRP
jgi:hypothetical protein